MKKILILLLIFFTLSGFAFRKEEKNIKNTLDILPLMSTESLYGNRVWVGTFQLVWNDLMDELVKGDVEFSDGTTSDVVKGLNKQTFKTSDLSEAAYYKAWGKASFDLRDKIQKGIKEKFNETSDIIDQIDWSPASGKYILYAMLKKDFKFIKAFDKLGADNFADKAPKVNYFGIKPDHNNALGKNIAVLFYENENDFALKLFTEGNDEVFLYRTDENKTFDKLYSDMIVKTENYQGVKRFGSSDYFKVPEIKLYHEKLFKDVCGKHIKGADFVIDKALETVDFKMSNEGVKLKSEAAIITRLILEPPEYNSEPRYFYFNDTFIIFLKEKEKSQPYFALRVDDVALLSKTAKK